METNTANIILKNAFKSADLSNELLQSIISAFTPIRFKKNQIIQDKHRTPGYLYLIEKGIARHYYKRETKEYTSWFSKEGDFMANSGFFSQKPVHEIIIALEDMETYALSYTNFEKFCQQSHNIERFVRHSLVEQLYLLDEYIAETFLFSATERYEKFLQQFPDIILRIPLIYVANFLGMSPETLSRVRAQR
jgi:CRP/FNR family transcriptional regulator, anaerobic regulatory protein